MATISVAASAMGHHGRSSPCRVFRSDSVRREGHRITVDPESRATWRRRTATSPAARQPERTDKSARSSSTTKPPGADARNSDTVVTVRKAACRSGAKEAEATPEVVTFGGSRATIKVGRSDPASSSAVRSAYFGRRSSNTIASAPRIPPVVVLPFGRRGAIGNGSVCRATRAKHARARGAARFAPARGDRPRNSSS